MFQGRKKIWKNEEMRTKTYGVKTIFDAANQYSWFSLLYFGRTVQAACCFPSEKLLVWRGGYRFFFVLSNAHAIRSGSPRSRTPGQSGGYKICRAKSWQFPPGMVEFSKQSPLVQVSLNEKCPWDLPHITWIFWSRRIFTKVVFFLISATGIKTCDLQTILKQCAWQILP